MVDDPSIEDLSDELAQELSLNTAEAAFVDPRSIPSRFSLLKQMALSPAHYRHAAQQPQDDSFAARLAGLVPPGTKRSDALRFGTAAHALLFKTGTVGVYTGARRAGPEWKRFQQEAADRGHVEILNAREYVLAVDVIDAICRNETAIELLFADTIVEQRLDWKWEDREFRSTPDARSKKIGGHLVDLKTAQSSQPTAFMRHAMRYWYHAQAALYCEALESLDLGTPSACYLIAVEKTKPHPVTVVEITPEVVEQGRKSCRLWFEQLKNCEASNVWPEYVQRIVPWELEENAA